MHDFKKAVEARLQKHFFDKKHIDKTQEVLINKVRNDIEEATNSSILGMLDITMSENLLNVATKTIYDKQFKRMVYGDEKVAATNLLQKVKGAITHGS